MLRCEKNGIDFQGQGHQYLERGDVLNIGVMTKLAF